MSMLTPFSQSALLASVATDPVTRNGVCVALCDHWLALLKRNPDAASGDRLQRLQQYLPQAITYQQQYAQLRASHGREDARRQAGQHLGLQYTDQTTIMRAFVGTGGIRQKLAADIGSIGAAATWTLRFADGSGHAIAGFCGLAGRPPIMKLRLHVFDPNIGEYTGDLQELDDILNDLLTHFPLYRTVTDVHRTSEG